MADNHARQRVAREFQKANPGTSYTRALRQVTGHRRRPLTALLGHAGNGTPVWLNLDWITFGGNGAHCFVIGPNHGGISKLLQQISFGLMNSQKSGDAELVVCASNATSDGLAGTADRRLGVQALGDFVESQFARRWQLMKALGGNIEQARERGNHLPQIIALIEVQKERARPQNPGPDMNEWTGTEYLSRLLRLGRSAGISVVLGAPSEPLGPQFADAELSQFELHRAQISAGMSLTRTCNMRYGDQAGVFDSVVYTPRAGHGALYAPAGSQGDALAEFTFEQD